MRLVFVCSLMLAWWGPVRAAQLPDFTSLVKAASPAIVNISSTRKITLEEALPPGTDLPDDAQLRDFLRRFFGDGGGPSFDSESLGSGFIISSDGYILTNWHVVKGAEEIIVKLGDRRQLAARIIGSDTRTDLALLKIDAKNLPVARIGDSSTLQPGEWVVAIGSPFGFDHSATAGIVSALGRSLPDENYVPFIQTDVAINPGNSGGPLLNLQGEVIGVNSLIYSQTGGFMGLSFAIPINLAMNVVNQLKATGHVTRGWLGVYIQAVTRDLAQSFGLNRPEGALVSRVMSDSPARKAGIRAGDILLTFNGKRLNESSDLPPLVASTPIGAKVPVRVLRDGKVITLTVKVEALPEATAQKKARSTAPKPHRLYGMELRNLTTKERKDLGIESGGVMVEQASGDAAAAGIREGDVITMMDNQPVRDLAQFKRLLNKAPKGRPLALLVQREGDAVFIALKSQP
jgi:serine protease Do